MRKENFMPCNIGYKSYAKIKVPEPLPETFKEESQAPEIDESLLQKLGEEDPEFLEWAEELNPSPLLKEALKRTLSKVDAGGVDFKINSDGRLEAKGQFITAREKQILSEKSTSISNQWQFEVLGIVAELLGYSVTITVKGNESILEAEEEGKTHPCNYIRIVRKGNTSTLTFEHFKSRDKLSLETAKLLKLAHRLGIKIALVKNEVSEGDPFPDEGRLATGNPHKTHKH
jgi:hypothetical protein